jgi:hypothetical protein
VYLLVRSFIGILLGKLNFPEELVYNVCRVFWTHISLGTLVDLQLDAQNSYLFTYNTIVKILDMFRALPCSSSGGLRRNCIYAASGIVTVCKK